MAQDTLSLILFSILDLLKGSLIFSIPVFAFVFIAIFVQKALSKKYQWTWFKSSAITTYFFMFSLASVLYVLPIIDVFTTTQTVSVLPEFAPTPLEIVLPIILQFVRLLVVALILSFILMPLEFVGLYLFEAISKKTKVSYSVRLFLAVFLSTLFTLAITIFLAPWIITGLIYLIFFGFE